MGYPFTIGGGLKGESCSEASETENWAFPEKTAVRLSAATMKMYLTSLGAQMKVKLFIYEWFFPRGDCISSLLKLQAFVVPVGKWYAGNQTLLLF